MTDNFPAFFAKTFAKLDRHNLDLLGDIYAPDIHFTDPLHDVTGLDAMRAYFAQMYANVTHISFDFHQCDSVREGQALLRWTMTFCHPRLNKGRAIQVEGCSCLFFHDQRVSRHIDYYDAGALLYEHIPLLGGIIHWLKGRLA
ncbi:MAG: nuclear transport factor 2 family protein [Halopseudomonas sp.]